MLPPFFAKFCQIAWVTDDLDRSLATFRDQYRIPSFFVMDATFKARVGGEHGTMALRIALAKVDGIEYELIQPIGGGIDAVYRDVLPKDGSHANVFHHFCIKVTGPEENWEKRMAELQAEAGPVYYEGFPDSPGHFCYTDDRRTLGHYIEHVWFSPELQAQMDAVVPHYHT